MTTSVLLEFMPKEMSLMELVEFAGQMGAWTSFVHLIDTPQNALPCRLGERDLSTNRVVRRVDGLQRNALGRKRRVPK